MKVAAAVYGLNRIFEGTEFKVDQLIREAAAIGFDGIDLGYYWGNDIQAEMKEAKQTAAGLGIETSNYICRSNLGTAAGENRLESEIDTIRRALDEAAFFGCSSLRVFAGGRGLDFTEFAPKIAAALAVCAEYAEKNGIVMALEDHGALCKNSAQQLYYIRQVNSESLRLNVDIGNYFLAGETPEHGTAAAAPFAAMVHVKDFLVINNTPVSVPVGEGFIDFRRCFRLLKDAGYDGYVTLEYECSIGTPRHGIATSLVNTRRFAAEC